MGEKGLVIGEPGVAGFQRVGADWAGDGQGVGEGEGDLRGGEILGQGDPEGPGQGGELIGEGARFEIRGEGAVVAKVVQVGVPGQGLRGGGVGVAAEAFQFVEAQPRARVADGASQAAHELGRAFAAGGVADLGLAEALAEVVQGGGQKSLLGGGEGVIRVTGRGGEFRRGSGGDRFNRRVGWSGTCGEKQREGQGQAHARETECRANDLRTAQRGEAGPRPSVRLRGSNDGAQGDVGRGEPRSPCQVEGEV